MMVLPAVTEGSIEDTVDLSLRYPSVSERYWTKYYFIPKERKRPGSSNGETKTADGDAEESDGVKGRREEREEPVEMETESNGEREKGVEAAQQEEQQEEEEGGMTQAKVTYSTLDSSGHVCVMVHTNKLCLVTLSTRHPALAPGREIKQVSYEVGKFNRLENQVSGKGKRGAQMMGPQSPVCIVTCDDGARYAVLAGVHGKLVEVNERLLTNPKLLRERPDAEGYLAVILPPIRNGDAPLRRLITAEEYWATER